MLGDRLSLGMIKHMRAGRRRVPAWVSELLDRELAKIETGASEARKVLARPPPPRPPIRAWRLHRLAQKEKAGD